MKDAINDLNEAIARDNAKSRTPTFINRGTAPGAEGDRQGHGRLVRLFASPLKMPDMSMLLSLPPASEARSRWHWSNSTKR